MSYVIYNRETTRLLDNKNYESERAAKAARTRACNSGRIATASDWEIAETSHFRNNIEKTKIVKNLMSGKDVEISVNTPLHLDPSSETYWCM